MIPVRLISSIRNRASVLLALFVTSMATPSGCNAAEAREFDPRTDGRAKRMLVTLPFVPFVYGWMGYHILTDDASPKEFSFTNADVYRHAGALKPAAQISFDEEILALFETYAPILVQERTEDIQYSPSADRIGAAHAYQSREGKKVSIDTSDPEFYIFTSHTEIDGKSYLQLNYTYWLPEHPKTKRLFDPEKGKIDGQTVRITLNQENVPFLMETVSNCGCFHKVHPADWLEQRIKAEGNAKTNSVRKKVRFRIDLCTPEPALLEAESHPVLFSSAGTHQIVKVGHEVDIAKFVQVPQPQTIALQAYEELERGGPDGLGIFQEDRLVAGADRPETWLLYPSGMYHAGTPRHHEVMQILFDQYDFEDSQLLDRNLNLPSDLSAPAKQIVQGQE